MKGGREGGDEERGGTFTERERKKEVGTKGGVIASKREERSSAHLLNI